MIKEMKTLDWFELFLIILFPLLIPLLWWLVSPLTDTAVSLGVIFVAQVFVAFSLSLIAKKQRNREEEANVFAKVAMNSSFLSLYERSPIPYLVISHRGEILQFNPAAVNLFKTEVSALTGLNLFDQLISEGKDLSVLLGKISSGLTINEAKVGFRTVVGDERWVSLSVYAYEPKTQRLVSLTDITTEKLVDTAKSEFVALATHQLRTPISAIRWNLELLQRYLKDSKTPEMEKYLHKIERNTMRMIALINDFLSVSKLESGSFATNFEDLDLTTFFTAITDEYTEKIAEKNITLATSYNPENFVFKTDKRLLHIIVSNLVSNAVKYINPNGRIDLSYEMIGNELYIKVSDDGIGIPEDDLPKMFSKFFRASNALAIQAEGTGLGLYVVKQSVEKLGGSLQLETAENQGASFTIVLPLL